MKENDIVSVVASSGEYVGKLKSITPLTLINPRMILRNPENGEMGFARGIAVTGEEGAKEATFHNYVFVVPTNDGVANAFQDATGEIVTPPKPSIVT